MNVIQLRNNLNQIIECGEGWKEVVIYRYFFFADPELTTVEEVKTVDFIKEDDGIVLLP